MEDESSVLIGMSSFCRDSVPLSSGLLLIGSRRFRQDIFINDFGNTVVIIVP